MGLTWAASCSFQPPPPPPAAPTDANSYFHLQCSNPGRRPARPGLPAGGTAPGRWPCLRLACTPGRSEDGRVAVPAASPVPRPEPGGFRGHVSAASGRPESPGEEERLPGFVRIFLLMPVQLVSGLAWYLREPCTALPDGHCYWHFVPWLKWASGSLKIVLGAERSPLNSILVVQQWNTCLGASCSISIFSSTPPYTQWYFLQRNSQEAVKASS